MTRTLALVALAVLLGGCSRYGTNPQGGPFSRTKKQPPPPLRTPGPPGPPAAGTPPVVPSATQPEPPPPPDDARLVPARPAAPLAPVAPEGVIPAGGVEPAATAFPPFRKPRPEPQPNQLPSPFAPTQPQPPAPGPMPPDPSPAQPPTPAPAPTNLTEVKKVVQTAAERWAKVDTYETVVTRRELTPKGNMNAEVLVYQFRKEPMGLFTRNIGETGKGREVVYNPTKYGDKLHVMLGEGDNRLVKAGFKAPPISPDDPRVKEKARYSIRESGAGFGTPIRKVAGWVEKVEAGTIPADALTFHGPVNRPEYPYPLVGVSLKLRPNDDPTIPGGGVRQWYFDLKPDSPSCGMPVVMTAHDTKGSEVEYYQFDKIRLPAGLTDADFAPDRLGKKR